MARILSPSALRLIALLLAIGGLFALADDNSKPNDSLDGDIAKLQDAVRKSQVFGNFCLGTESEGSLQRLALQGRKAQGRLITALWDPHTRNEAAVILAYLGDGRPDALPRLGQTLRLHLGGDYEPP